MKKVLTAIAISMSALIATSAMAGSHDYRDNHYNSNYKNNSHWNNNDKDRRYNNDSRYDRNDRYNRAVNPSREWRSGQTLPRQYNSSRYEVNNNSVLKRLPKANRNQQWYKVNGDYVLVNERNDKIVRIIN